MICLCYFFLTFKVIFIFIKVKVKQKKGRKEIMAQTDVKPLLFSSFKNFFFFALKDIEKYSQTNIDNTLFYFQLRDS
jgi:hypothetical protein